MKLKVYLHIIRGWIECICLQINKGCDCEECEQDTVTYDQYKDIEELIKNNGNKNYKKVK